MASYANETRHDFARQYEEPQASRLVRNVLFVLFTLASVIGNSIVIRSIVMISNRRTLTYVFVTNLAVAELTNTLLLPTIQVYDELQTWIFGAFLCHVVSPLQIVTVLSITWTIVIISYLRYRTLVCRPSVRQWKSSYKVVMLVSVWAFSFAFSTPTFIYTTLVTSPYEDSKHWCLTLFDGDSFSSYPGFSKYNLVRLIVNFCLPVVLMGWFYGSMIVTLKYHMSEVGPLRLTMASSSQSSNDHPQDSTTEATPSHPSTSLRTRMYVQDEDLLRMIYVVVIIFIVLYFPYQLLFMLEYYQIVTIDKWYYHQITRRYLFLFTCLPSALHPLCYGTVSNCYAKIFSCIFLCRL